jgi:DNA-binding Lrp family transcriptional regulator
LEFYGKVIKVVLVECGGEIMAVLAYILFKVNSGTEREVCQKLVEFDEIIQADIVFGEYDVLSKIETQDLAQLEEFVSQKVRNVPNVLVTSTMIISREYRGKNNRKENK